MTFLRCASFTRDCWYVHQEVETTESRFSRAWGQDFINVVGLWHRSAGQIFAVPALVVFPGFAFAEMGISVESCVSEPTLCFLCNEVAFFGKPFGIR